MNWILGITILLILLAIYQNKINIKKRNKTLSQLKSNWGNPKQAYLYDFSKISSYHNAVKSSSSIQNIERHINDDLDLDDLYTYLDRTTSAIGQQYLYHKLHTIQTPESVRKLDDTIDYFKVNENTRLETQTLLLPLSHKSTYSYHYLFTDETNQFNNKKINIAYLLNIALLGIIGLCFINLAWSLLVLPIFCTNLFLHYKNKYAQFNLLNATQYFKVVYKTANKLKSMHNIIDTIPITPSKHKLQNLYTLTYFFNSDNIFKDEASSILWFPIELLKILFNVELIAFELFSKLAINHKGALKEDYEIIANIDLAISLTSLQVNNTLCQPTFIKHKEIYIENLIHPLVDNCVTNNIHLVNKSLLLTGTNMAGKTTFIRALTINTILAQTLGFVFATRYEAPFLKINTSIRITDNLQDNTSYYLQEVKLLKTFIIETVDNTPHLFVLDEVLKGTNTIERISAAYAILKYLNETESIVLVSTHDLELIDLLKQENYQCQYLQESIINNELHFDYKLKLGSPQTTNAIKILELNDFPKEITDLAYKTKKMFS